MFGCYIEVHIELKIPPSHGQSFFGCKVDLVLQELGLGILKRLDHCFLYLQLNLLDIITLKLVCFALKKNEGIQWDIAIVLLDNPVGTGYNYVEDANDEKFFVKTDVEAATDLTALLEEILTEIRNFRRAFARRGRVRWWEICSHSRIISSKSN
ncbi:hypothetical protein JRO89_XS04G0171200 [Xanthoceras sorbifolium]|uniref:Uncharacterized protein n=1 Tax=Xanthoceras sorbifolium TaxID=99658 RepID=A0ABQ8I5N7_9ROSI|nr:hypothetical protein JRO89_XS04G0171200 [Xanthoceras sorbifolium]